MKRYRIALFVALAAIFLFWAVKGVREVVDYNDFEVFYFGAGEAMERSTDLYRLDSPIKDRPFVYPPGAAILIMPLAWVDHHVAGVIFTLLRLAALGALIWGSLRFSGAPPGDRTAWLLGWLATVLIVFRPIDNEFGNGQINVLVSLMTTGGVWLVMMNEGRSRRWFWIAGAVALAVGITIKPPPVLLLAVLLVYRKWAALGLSLALVLVLSFALPHVWFGSEAASEAFGLYREDTSGMFLNARDDDEQNSFYELAAFVTAQARAPEEIIYEDEEFYVERGGELVETEVPPPWSAETARLIWFGIGLAIGAAYLLCRVWLRRGAGAGSSLRSGEAGRTMAQQGAAGPAGFAGAIDWSWDLAMLSALVPLTSPLVRKAHLVILIVPVAWLVCRTMARVHAEGGWGAFASRHTKFLTWAGAMFLLMVISEDVPLPLPGLPMPLHPAPLLSVMLLAGLLIAAARWPGDATASRAIKSDL